MKQQRIVIEIGEPAANQLENSSQTYFYQIILQRVSELKQNANNSEVKDAIRES